MEFGNVMSAGRAVLSGGTPGSLHIHVSSLGSAWLLHRRVVSCQPHPHPWCSVPLAVIRAEAPDPLCSMTYTGTPPTLNLGDAGEAGSHRMLHRIFF